MSDKVIAFLMKLLIIVVLIGVSGLVSAIFYYIKKKDLFGGFLGGMVIAFIGALIGAFILGVYVMPYVKMVLNFFIEGPVSIDIISSLAGAYLAVYIMNKLNHDKDRTKY